MKGDFTMKEIIKEIIEFDLDEGRMDYLDDMIDVFSKDGCEMGYPLRQIPKEILR